MPAFGIFGVVGGGSVIQKRKTFCVLVVVEQIGEAFGRNNGVFVVTEPADNYFFKLCILLINFDFYAHSGLYCPVKILQPFVAFAQNGQSFAVNNRTVRFVSRFLVAFFIQIKNEPVGQPLKIKRRFLIFCAGVYLVFQLVATHLRKPGRAVNTVFGNQFFPNLFFLFLRCELFKSNRIGLFIFGKKGIVTLQKSRIGECPNP